MNRRQDFPILNRKINGPSYAKASEGKKPLVYLDSAATSQKPKQVLNAISDYYQKHNANVHRGIHTLSVEATEMYEAARKKVADFVGVKDPAEIIFVRNATEAINLVAYSWGRFNISKGDEIVVTVAEHHSNFVPWQQLAIQKQAKFKVVPINKETGEIDLKALGKLLTKKTKIVAFAHVSNVLGTINDVLHLSLVVRRLAPQAIVLVDGAQAVPHMPVDISEIGCDFYVFTGHKMLGPTGIGVLWGRRELLETMTPFLFGGEMISKVSLEKSTWNELPWKFEAGTPDIAGAIGLGAAVDYLDKIGMDKVREHDVELTKYAIEKLSKIDGVIIYGPKDVKKRSGVVAFNVGSIHAHDVASILDSEGIAVRSGHHCAQPLMDFLGVSSVARASFYLYNSIEEVDRLVEGVLKVKEVFKI
ncbi:MAG: cysteine desulfurase [Patescibacteria group bacterium]